MFSGSVGTRRLVNFPIDPYLDINYIYLDSKEMKNFAQTEHKYLIEQVRLSSYKGIVRKSNFRTSSSPPNKYYDYCL